MWRVLLKSALAVKMNRRSSTIAPYANYGHCETSKANSSSCLLKGLRRFDGFLDSFAIDVVLILRWKRLARNKV